MGSSGRQRDGRASDDRDAQAVDAASPWSGESGSETDADSSSAVDSGSGGGMDSGVQPSRCAPGGPGLTTCGAGSESCCTSLEVTGGTYDRTYSSAGNPADPATVSGFQLDKYEVTVGRFRQFVNAWNGGAGYAPPAGSGKHAHLNGGSGLVDIGSGSGATYETGWVSSDDASIAPTDANLACDSQFATWTTTAGSNDRLPINCVNWWESSAFCIWDGGFLPSESEWEYAAAGGSQERQYPWGSTDPGTTNQYAIYDCNYPSRSGRCSGGAAPVGTAALGAGLWGQLDLAGNVSEWSLDSFAPYAAPCVDCAGLTAAPYRVLRGGYFYNDPSYLLASSRSDDPPAARSLCIGLRCARSP